MNTTMHRLATLLIVVAVAAGCGRSGQVDAAKRNAGTTSGYVGTSGKASTASTADAIGQKLKADPQLAGASIDAKEENGAIVLSGKVKSIAQKDRAEQLAIEEQKSQNLQIGILDNIEVRE